MFSPCGKLTDKGALAYVVMGLMIGAFLLGAYVSNPDVFTAIGSGTSSAKAQPSKHFTLVIEPVDIKVAPDAIWHAWTFNGTVPGPTMHLEVGDSVSFHVINRHNLTHSFHTHLLNYNMTSDGSQANVISAMAPGAMIAPGKDYTYNFQVTEPGIFYYHCHSSDHHPISYHIRQGLYGAIMVDDRNTPKVDHDWVIFMGEMGSQVTGKGAPPFIMNGMGIPGGESALEETYTNQGFDGVKAMINTTLPTFSMKLGETARLNVINIGDQVHSFHLHNMKMVSEWYFPGRSWPAGVVQLVPGAADSVLVTPVQPGVWLFHCHVVFHADAGMIGVIIVSK